jgi:hypothetical protein
MKGLLSEELLQFQRMAKRLVSLAESQEFQKIVPILFCIIHHANLKK